MYTFSYFPGCENFQIDHKDGNKDNNDIITNLEWVSPKENVNRAINIGLRKSWKADNNPQSKVSENDVRIICDMVLKGYSNEEIIDIIPNSNDSIIKEIIDIIPNSNDSIIKEIISGRTWKNIVSIDTINLMKNTRYPAILTIEQKHQICKYFELNPISFIYKGAKKDYINSVLYNLNIPITDSTHRMAKRLYYKYQDLDIVSLYNY